MAGPRNTTTRDRHRRTIRRDEPPCAYANCLFPGTPIDYHAHHLHPLSFTVDHTIPLNRGGADQLDNKTAMHRACNRHKSDKADGDKPADTALRFVTHRDWWSRGA